MQLSGRFQGARVAASASSENSVVVSVGNDHEEQGRRHDGRHAAHEKEEQGYEQSHHHPGIAVRWREGVVDERRRRIRCWRRSMGASRGVSSVALSDRVRWQHFSQSGPLAAHILG